MIRNAGSRLVDRRGSLDQTRRSSSRLIWESVTVNLTWSGTSDQVTYVFCTIWMTSQYLIHCVLRKTLCITSSVSERGDMDSENHSVAIRSIGSQSLKSTVQDWKHWWVYNKIYYTIIEFSRENYFVILWTKMLPVVLIRKSRVC